MNIFCNHTGWPKSPFTSKYWVSPRRRAVAVVIGKGGGFILSPTVPLILTYEYLLKSSVYNNVLRAEILCKHTFHQNCIVALCYGVVSIEIKGELLYSV